MNWKTVAGYEGYYEVSETGELRSIDRIVSDSRNRKRLIRGRRMKLTASKGRDGDGYLVVNLRKYGKANVCTVHRLVAEAFIPNPNNFPTVNHKDGNKKNNNTENLEWVTFSENNSHALNIGLRKARGVPIEQRSQDGKWIAQYNSISEASRATGINRRYISNAANGMIDLAGGFLWRKVEKCNDYPHMWSTAEDELLPEEQERSLAEDIVCSDGNICVKRQP